MRNFIVFVAAVATAITIALGSQAAPQEVDNNLLQAEYSVANSTGGTSCGDCC